MCHIKESSMGGNRSSFTGGIVGAGYIERN